MIAEGSWRAAWAFRDLRENMLSYLRADLERGREQGAFTVEIDDVLIDTFASMIMGARFGRLAGDFGPEAVADRLSGLIIGHELRAGLALGWAGEAVRLVGEPALCARYRDGLAALGQASEAGPAHAAVAGFRRLAALEGGAGS